MLLDGYWGFLDRRPSVLPSLGGEVDARWLGNTTQSAPRRFVPSAREPWSRADESYLCMENGGLIEDEFQAKCVKGALNGFGVIQRCSRELFDGVERLPLRAGYAPCIRDEGDWR